MEKIVFLDRDGVINKDGYGWTKDNYITRWEDFYFLPKVLEALKKLKEEHFTCIIISNQQCIAKGLMTIEELSFITNKMIEKIKESGGDIAKVFYCPHSKSANCLCKKPKPGLFFDAQKNLGIKNLEEKFYIGDMDRDIEAGKNAGLKTILVLSGKTKRGDVAKWTYKPDFECENLLDASNIVIKNSR
ncbi:histidinol-phosphate phosphatase family protein [Candidatus Omnitrophus magneticus]|uniref:D,D-heptose 1,7-bisphosphate phosphatase n=1 Tax=Candidatus Omnitrophus magneticus TaxID=1609969 RepID=A0A0F0CMA2_9BACT|nr:histidinol-phosphate phosphatase family protein [Candidatus Omnitrophus magneticus]